MQRHPPLSTVRVLAVAAIAATLPGVAAAHPEAGQAAGFVAGFAHPFGGLDHLLAMGTVGAIAASVRGRAKWMLPLGFLAVMLLGFALARSGVGVPFVEAGIALSLVVLGAALALGLRASLAWAGALGALFALFHGHAHGSEMPPGAGGEAYAAGFTVASTAIVGAGLAAASLLLRAGPRADRLLRVAGALVAAAGIGFLAYAG